MTLPQIEGALSAIDRRERRDRIGRIFDFRIAQAEQKSFKEAIRRLEQEDRLARLREARSKGLRLPAGVRTEKEQRALQAQGHLSLSEMPTRERTRFEKERDAMWSTIPEHLRGKAAKLAGGR
jgi:hypothetical protein